MHCNDQSECAFGITLTLTFHSSGLNPAISSWNQGKGQISKCDPCSMNFMVVSSGTYFEDSVREREKTPSDKEDVHLQELSEPILI